VRVGAHVSVAGGLHRAVGNAVAAGCEALQVFLSNSRGWAPPATADAGDERFRAALAGAGLGPLFVHAPYLANFASASNDTVHRSTVVVGATLRRAAAVGAAGVVVHAGAALGVGRAAGLRRTREALLPLLDAAPAGGPQVLLELLAGTRGALAARFEEMAELLAACDGHPRLGVCLDTCHAHAAGYDLADPAAAGAALDELFAVLPGRVALVHANDSRDPVGAGRDRHCPIGSGTIGAAGFAAVLAHPGLADLAVVTETTGDPDQLARDVACLKRLRAAAAARR
jgi:deoxyribonuclease-4